MTYRTAVVHGANPKQIHAQNRAHAGAGLYRIGRVSKVVTTGKYEADDLARIVLNDGVPEADIIPEKRSKTTYQNLIHTKDIFDLLSRNLGSLELAYLISQEWHEARLLYLAKRLLGRKYPYYFYSASDGRDEKEINADIKLERMKILVDRITLMVPAFGGLINSSAYWALSKVQR